MKTDFSKLSGVIVGLGSIGNRHLQNCLELGVGKMTVVRRTSANSHFAAPAGVSVVHSIEEALRDQPDFGIVCNPTHLHASTAIEFLQGNCHVLVEKPLGKTLGVDEQALSKLAAGSDRVVAMAYCMRDHPAYALAKQQIESGSIGKCLYAKAWFEGYLPDWHPWEDYRESYAALPDQGGGVLRTLDHEMDFLQWVLGPVATASGRAINTNGIGIKADDLAMYTLNHPQGVVSQVTTAFCRKPQSRGFEFVGDQGTIEFRFENNEVILQTTTGEEPKTLLDVSSFDINQMYLNLLDDFLVTISGQSSATLPLLQSGWDCMNAIEILDGRCR